MTHAPHIADALVVTCMDYRLHNDQLVKFFHDQGIHSWDLRTQQGCAKDLCLTGEEGQKQSLLDAVRIAKDLHGVKRVFLMNHMDCGAYGGAKRYPSREEEQRHHEQDLRAAYHHVQAVFPELSIHLYVIDLVEDDGRIELFFLPVRESIPALVTQAVKEKNRGY